MGKPDKYSGALLNLVLHSRVHGHRTCGSIGNRLLCTYKSVILHRATAAIAATAADHDDSNIETSHTVNKETTRGGSLLQRGREAQMYCGARGKGFGVRFPPMDMLQQLLEGWGRREGNGRSYLLYRGGKVLNPLSSAHEHNTPTELYYGNFTPPS